MRQLIIWAFAIYGSLGVALVEAGSSGSGGEAGATAAAEMKLHAAADGANGSLEAPSLAPKMVTQEMICELIESAASRHGLPVDFFTRLIWMESSFRIAAVSPKGAQGIAQFMPGTAAERGLADPFDPEQAIPASASFLRDLHERFGNLGLAAAAYNAGPNRVAAWLAKRSGLPLETQHYVNAITGRAADEWAVLRNRPEDREGGAGPATCIELAALLAKPRAPQQVVAGAPPAPKAPWGAQVAGNFSQDRALASYASLQKKHASILGSQQPMVIRAASRSRGPRPMVHVRVPAQTRQEAEDVCNKLRSAGGNCMVVKN